VPEALQQGTRFAVGFTDPEHASRCPLVAQKDVLGDGEAVDNIEFLVHSRDAEIKGCDRIGDGDFGALPVDDSSVGVVHPGEDLDQCRLPGPVLAQHTVHLGLAHLEINALESLDTGETLGDPMDLQEPRGMVVVDHAGNITHTYVDAR
jgi:hypothetical protein